MFDYFIYLILLAVGALAGYMWRARSERGLRDQERWTDRHAQAEDGGPPYGPQQPNPSPPAWATKRREQIQLGSGLMQEVEALKSRLERVEVSVERLEGARRVQTEDRTPTGGWRRHENDPRRGAGGANREQPPRSQPPRHAADSYSAAQESYLKLSSDGPRDLPIQPLFVTLESEGGAGAIGESVRRFRQSESRHQVFIVFPKSGGEGWLYPNPRHPYTEAMRYVFPWLTHANYDDYKHTINPLPARLIEAGVWEALPG